MPLMPKRVKYRKSQRGRIRGNATRGNRVSLGDFGLQSTQGGYVKATTIEACRIAAMQYIRGDGKLFIRIFPHKPNGFRQGQPGILGCGDQAGNGVVRSGRAAPRGSSRSAGSHGLQAAIAGTHDWPSAGRVSDDQGCRTS